MADNESVEGQLVVVRTRVQRCKDLLADVWELVEKMDRSRPDQEATCLDTVQFRSDVDLLKFLIKHSLQQCDGMYLDVADAARRAKGKEIR